MKYIKIGKDLSERLRRSRSQQYFKPIPNKPNPSLTKSDYAPIINKLDITNPKYVESVDTIFSLLLKNNPDIEKSAQFQNISNAINTEMHAMSDTYDKKLRKYLVEAKKIKDEMFNLVKKFYNSGYKIIAYDVMRQLSDLSEWIDDTVNIKDLNKNKHKIKEIFSPDSDFHKSFLYLNKIKGVLQKPELKDELAKFSTEIHRNEKKQVVDIGKCIKAADAGSAVGSFFGLLADKGHTYYHYYVLNSDFGRDYDALKRQKPLSLISTIKDSFVEIDKKCNIAREANGKVGIFDFKDTKSTQTYDKDRKKRFNDFKTILLNIFENEEKYDAENYQLNNKSTDFFFKTIPSSHDDVIEWGKKNKAENIINLFKAVVTECGMKGGNYNESEKIAKNVGLDRLISDLTSKLNTIANKPGEFRKHLKTFIETLNRSLSEDDVTFLQSEQGQFFLEKHKGLNVLSEGIKKITGGVSSGFEFITNDRYKVIKISKSMTEWLDEKSRDLEEDKKKLKNLALGEHKQTAENFFNALSPDDIKTGLKNVVNKNAKDVLQGNIGAWKRKAKDDFEIERQKRLFDLRYKSNNSGAYYPEWGCVSPYQQNPYNQWSYPQQQSLPLSQDHIKQIVKALREGIELQKKSKSL